ncbi:MAG: hypothetical protein WD669_02795 [Pirellulales bacterium]
MTAIVLASEASEMAAIVVDLIKASLAPAVISAGLLLIVPRLNPRAAAGRFAGAAFAIAYLAGYAVWLCGERSSFVPAPNWPTGNWTVYLAPVAALVALAASGRQLRASWRLILALATSIVAAWLLVPSWPTLWPPQYLCIPLLAAYFLALAMLLDPLADRFSAPVFLGALAASAAGLSLIVTAMSSQSSGQKLAVAAAALAGCAVASAFAKPGGAARGIALVYAIVVGGWAFVAGSYPVPPHYGYFLVPAVPLVLWAWRALRSRV